MPSKSADNKGGTFDVLFEVLQPQYCPRHMTLPENMYELCLAQPIWSIVSLTVKVRRSVQLI
jgi:hypothetical protein